MLNKVRDPCSLERISRTPGRDFPGHLCLWVCGVHRWWEPILFAFLGWHSEDLRAGRSQGSETGPLWWWPVQGYWVVYDGQLCDFLCPLCKACTTTVKLMRRLTMFSIDKPPDGSDMVVADTSKRLHAIVPVTYWLACCESHSVVSNSLWPYGLCSP